MIALDDSNEFLNKDLKDQIYDIYCYLPPATQFALVDALSRSVST
jgi:ATP-dependent RNA helicase